MLLRTSKVKYPRATSWVKFSHGSLLCKASMRILNSWVNVMLTILFSQDKIMEMECELLISSFKNPHTGDLVTENIGRIADGSSSHSANALKLGLKKAFDLKKPPPGVKLRCSWTSCSSYNNHVSVSSIGTNLYCQMCSNRRSSCWQCVGCGYNRTGNHTSCQNCKKIFV